MFILRVFFFFQAEDGIRAHCVTGVQTCALPILKLFKETYQDIINELGLELGENYIQRLVQLSKKKIGRASCRERV